MSLLHHKLIQHLEDIIQVASLPRLLARSPGNPCNDRKTYGCKCWSSQSKQQKIATSHHHKVVSYSIFGLFILEDWQIDLHPKDPFLPILVGYFLWTLLSWLTAGTFNCFANHNSHPPEEGEPPEVSLGNCGLPCLLCCLLP